MDRLHWKIRNLMLLRYPGNIIEILIDESI